MIGSTLVDVDTIVQTLLKRDLPDAFVIREDDTDVLDNLPVVMWSWVGSGQTGNGPGLFYVTLTLTIVGAGDDVWQQSQIAYTALHLWPVTGTVPDVGWVQDVTDNSLPDTAPAGTGSKTNVRANATFDLQIRH